MSDNQVKSDEGIPLFELWDKYESIAMHFNDLIVKIRTQALGAVAGIATVAGILSKGSVENEYNWGLVAAVFFFLIVFWIAIWVLDFKYYNRLLEGAVNAILEIEKLSKEGKTHFTEIQISTYINDAVSGRKTGVSGNSRAASGRLWFYRIVLISLFLGLVVSSYYKFCA